MDFLGLMLTFVLISLNCFVNYARDHKLLQTDFQKSSWRWPWPKTLNDRLALSVFTLGGLFLIWYEQVLILPTYYSETNSLNVIGRWVFMLLMVGQIYGNMFMIITTDTSTRTIELSTKSESESWRYCKTCQTKVPPRSHHCVICDVCILKRDHHCWFAGYCIGFKNHRYYLVMLIYMTLLAAYGNLFNYKFVVQVVGGLGIVNVISFFMPHVRYILGFCDTYTFLITTLSSIGFILLLVFLWLLQIQLKQIFTGQMHYEKKKKIVTFNHGWKVNLIDILGPRWLLVWFVPWIQSPPPGDGFTFSEKKI